MIRNLLVCGLAAGLIGGLFAAGVVSLTGEPAVDQAIAFEEATAPAELADTAEAPAPVSRELQKTGGLLTALLVYGAAIGGLFALAFAFAYRRVGDAGPRTTAYWLAGTAFVAVYLVPFLKYPGNPPAVGDPSTIGRRTALYGAMLAVSLLAAFAAMRLRRSFARRLEGHAATALALVSYVVIVVGAGLALPAVHEVPRDFPATTLWQFREASVGLQLTLWVVIGVVFGYSAERLMAGRPVLARARA